MTNFSKILRFTAVFLFATCLGTAALRADSFSYSPDTLTFTPTSQDSVIGYVRVAYNGDTTGPGITIHGWISDGSSFFGTANDTTHTRSYLYIRVAYKPQSQTVGGQLSITDDSITRTVVLIGYAVQSTPTLSAEGPYFPNIPEGHDTCTSLRLVNTSSTPDTIHTVSWTHNSNGIFTWDSVSLPYILGAYDTVNWTFCFHAPDNTETNIDTLVLYYGSGDKHVSRIVEASATANTDGELTAVGPYFPEHIPEGGDTCVTMRVVNTGSDVDTVESISWSHNSNGIFMWDSTSVPFTLGAHDTTYLTFCYHAPDNTETYTDTITLTYNDASGSRHNTRIVAAAATDTTTPDGELELYSGPYFPDVVDEGHDTCATMKVINAGTDVDTIVSATWSHSPNGIFTWDSVSLPTTIASHDTDVWTFCFHAPDDTNLYIDTFTVRYRDHYNDGDGRTVTRIIEGKATDPSIVTCYTLYAATFAVTNVGDTSYIHMYIRNDLPVSATLTGCHISGTDDAAFRVDSANFPVTIASDTYDSVILGFIPHRHDGSDEYNATITALFTTSDTAHCHEATVSLVGYMPQSCSDTATVNVDTTGTDDVDVSGDSATYYAHRIDIVNNSNSTVIVSAVRFIDSSSHFYIYQFVPAVPDTLAPGAGMAVIIHFYGDTGQVYYDTLAVTINTGSTLFGGKGIPLTSTTSTLFINIKGAETAAPASVTGTDAQNGPDLMLYPNPSSGIVNMQLDGAVNATFQVFDVLGNVVAMHTGAGTWQWDATSGRLVSNGTYFIRASNGTTVTTKRLVLQR